MKIFSFYWFTILYYLWTKNFELSHSYKGSAIKAFVNMFRHRVNCRIQLFLNHNHIFLIILSNQVDSKTYLSKSATSANPMQVCRSILWEVKVNNYIHAWHINSSRYKIGTYQSFELSFSESLKNLDSLLLHVWSQVLVFKTLWFHLFGKELYPFVWPAKDYALVNNEFTVNFIEILKFFRFLHKDVVVSESQ